MDWVKLTLGRLSGFLLAIVPGAAALVVLGLHHPDWARQIRDIAYLGYRTKIALVIAAGFAAGWTVSIGFSGFVGGINGVLWGAMGQWLLGAEPQAKPWHDPNWRALLTAYLGTAAPENIEPISDITLQMQIQTANLYPEPQRSNMIAEARLNKSRADVNDFAWRGWWRHLHYDLTFNTDAVGRIGQSLAFHFQAAGLVVLWALPWTPALRQWWLVLGSIFWMSTFLFQTANYMIKTRDPWSSSTDQIAYLRGQINKQQTAEEEALI